MTTNTQYMHGTKKRDRLFYCTGCEQDLDLQREHKREKNSKYVCVYCEVWGITSVLIRRIAIVRAPQITEYIETELAGEIAY